MHLVILTINVDAPGEAAVSRVCERMGYRLHTTAVNVSEIGELPVYQPHLVFINCAGLDEEAQNRLISVVRERCEGAELMLAAPPRAMPALMARYKDAIREFLQLPGDAPMDETALEIAFARVSDKISANEQIRRLSAGAGTPSPPLVEEMLETERFIVVKQVVDKLSDFIGRIARDVEDGVKYFHSTPYFVSIHSCSLKVVANDRLYQEYFGNRVGEDSWAVFEGKAAHPEHCPVGKTVETGTVRRTRALARYPGGKKVPVIVHTAPIYDNHGRMTLVLEVMAGSREIRELRKELRTTQQKYQKLFDEVPDYIAVLDRNLRVTATNRRFKEAFGDPAGADIASVFTNSPLLDAEGPLLKTLQDGGSHSLETEMITKDGRRFHTILSTAPVATATGKLIQVIVIFKDTTEKRRLEDNLSTLGLMFSVVSHNIKNILTGLDAGLYQIDRGFYKNIPGEIEEGLEVAALMKERIRRLILDVLYYAKPRQLRTSRIDAAALVADVDRQIRPKMGARDIAFETHVDEQAGTFEADREIFRSILLNLLENAMEACMDPQLEREFSVRLSASAHGDKLRFDVIDNGVGMEEAQRQQIFSKFYSTKGHKGTGLGLFIAHQVITQHGGRIEVAATAGAGSHFTVLMPRQMPPEAETDAKTDEKDSSQREAGSKTVF